VTHVFNLGIVGSDADYVHRAGRVGRIGQRGSGAVLSVLQPDEVPQLLALGGSLRFTPRRVTAPEPMPLADLAARAGDGAAFSGASGEEERMAPEAAARALEDIFSLYDGAEAGVGSAQGGGDSPTSN
jgi:superfamily II DNA/RNA helicase